MKRTLLFVLLLFSSCKFINDLFTPEPEYAHSRHYIFFYDKVDETLREDFRKAIFQFTNKEDENILEYQPEGIKELSFTLYHPGNDAITEPISVSFMQHGEVDIRSANANKFLDEIALAYTDSKQAPYQAILHRLKKLLDEIHDTAAVYELLIISSMLETSGNIETRETDWERGHFRFVDGQNEFNPQQFDAAMKQLNDSNSWIYQNLIVPASNNPAVAAGKVIVHLNSRFPEIISPQGNRNVEREILHFWIQLFRAMNFDCRIRDGISITNCPFY